MSDQLFVEEQFNPIMWRWSEQRTWWYDMHRGHWLPVTKDRPVREPGGFVSIDTGVQAYRLRPISRLEFLLFTGRGYESTRDKVCLPTNPWGW